MSRVIAIDPGLDAVGVACFRMAGWRRGESFAQIVGRLTTYEVLRTKSGTPLADRLASLFDGLRDIVQDEPCERIYIEQPGEPGTYRLRQRRQFSKGAINGAALAKLNMAIGTLIAAGASELVEVTLVPAPRIQKKLRLRVVLSQLRHHRHPLAQASRVSPDLLDAIWLGATALTSPLHQPRVMAN